MSPVRPGGCHGSPNPTADSGSQLEEIGQIRNRFFAHVRDLLVSRGRDKNTPANIPDAVGALSFHSWTARRIVIEPSWPRTPHSTCRCAGVGWPKPNMPIYFRSASGQCWSPDSWHRAPRRQLPPDHQNQKGPRPERISCFAKSSVRVRVITVLEGRPLCRPCYPPTSAWTCRLESEHPPADTHPAAFWFPIALYLTDISPDGRVS